MPLSGYVDSYQNECHVALIFRKLHDSMKHQVLKYLFD